MSGKGWDFFELTEVTGYAHDLEQQTEGKLEKPPYSDEFVIPYRDKYSLCSKSSHIQ